MQQEKGKDLKIQKKREYCLTGEQDEIQGPHTGGNRLEIAIMPHSSYLKYDSLETRNIAYSFGRVNENKSFARLGFNVILPLYVCHSKRTFQNTRIINFPFLLYNKASSLYVQAKTMYIASRKQCSAIYIYLQCKFQY